MTATLKQMVRSPNDSDLSHKQPDFDSCSLEDLLFEINFCLQSASENLIEEDIAAIFLGQRFLSATLKRCVGLRWRPLFEHVSATWWNHRVPQLSQ